MPTTNASLDRAAAYAEAKRKIAERRAADPDFDRCFLQNSQQPGHWSSQKAFETFRVQVGPEPKPTPGPPVNGTVGFSADLNLVPRLW